MAWGVSTDEESFHGFYPTKEAALAAALDGTEVVDLEPGQRFWIGGGPLYRPRRSVDADWLLERLSEDAGDEAGEPAEDWQPAMKREDAQAMEAEIHAVVMKWLARTDNLPQFYVCEFIDEHRAPAPQPEKKEGTT